MSDGTANCIDIILAIILPPLGVFFKFGCGVSKIEPPSLSLRWWFRALSFSCWRFVCS